MKAKTKQKIWAVLGTLVMLLPLFLGLGQANVNAADETVNITLHKKVFENYPEEKENTGLEDEKFGGKPLAGAEFTVYEVTDRFYELLALKNKVGNKVYTFEKAVQKMTEEENYLKGNKGESFTTDKDGKAIFSDLESVINGHNAVYVFVETKLPDGVTQQSTPIVATLPFYGEDGINEDIHLYPKNEIKVNNVVIKKVGTDTEDPAGVGNAKFQLKNSEGKYFTGQYDENTGLAIFGDKPQDSPLISDNFGNINISGLLPDTYTLEEQKDAPAGYQIVGDESFKFVVKDDDLTTEDVNEYGEVDDTVYEVTDKDETFQLGSPTDYVDNSHAIENFTDENVDVIIENQQVLGNIDFVKKDINTKNILSGAEFKIAKDNGENKDVFLMVKTNDDGRYQYAWSDEVTEADGYEVKTLTSGADGKFFINDLKQGTYYLVETKAPDGYVLPADGLYQSFEVTTTSGTDEVQDEVVNQPKGVLPSTGGNGIIAFVAIGVALVGGVGFYFMKRSKSTEA